MKKLTPFANLTVALVLLAGALWTSGCSDNAPAPLNSPDGGSADLSKIVDQLIPEKYRAGSPGARPIWETLEQDQIVNDPLLADALAASDSAFDVFSVRIVWGTLGGATDVSSPRVNWSGGLGSNAAGFMGVRALIDFEPDQDTLLERISRNGLRWRSITHNDIDGIHVLIFHPKNVNYIVPPDVTFKTNPVTIVMPLFSLAKLDTVVRVDQNNGVSIQAHKVTDRDCPHGLLRGHWTFKSMNSGHFLGKWISADGNLMGYLGGAFATTADGRRGFRGQWVNVEGDFQAHLIGSWGYVDRDGPDLNCSTCDQRIGWFAGHFTDADGRVRGSIKGRFIPRDSDSSIVSHGPGTFFGRWKIDCRDNTDG